jgi:hypothetical protein
MYNQDDKDSDASLILAWKMKLKSMSKTVNEGFQVLDTDDNKKIGAFEVQAGFATCGKHISVERASQLIEKFVAPDGNLNQLGYVRLMASIDDATEEATTEKLEVATESKGPGFDTIALHAGYDPDKNTVFGTFELLQIMSMCDFMKNTFMSHSLFTNLRSWTRCTPRCPYL